MSRQDHWVRMDLTGEQEFDAKYAGKERDRLGDKNNMKNHMDDRNHSDLDNDILGCRTEMAVSSYFGVPFSKRDRTIGGHDVVLRCGQTIEVKSGREMHHNFLMAPDGRDGFVSDFGVLALTEGEGCPVWIVGFAFRKKILEAFDAKGLVQLQTPTWLAPQEMMIDIKKLKLVDDLWQIFPRYKEVQSTQEVAS